MSPSKWNIRQFLSSRLIYYWPVPVHTTICSYVILWAQPSLSPFQSRKIKRSAKFMKARNVEQRILKLQSCERVGQAPSSDQTKGKKWLLRDKHTHVRQYYLQFVRVVYENEENRTLISVCPKRSQPARIRLEEEWIKISRTWYTYAHALILVA